MTKIGYERHQPWGQSTRILILPSRPRAQKIAVLAAYLSAMKNPTFRRQLYHLDMKTHARQQVTLLV